MFANALLMLALDGRDRTLIEGMLAGARRLGIQKLFVFHVHDVTPFPEPLAKGVDTAAPDRPAQLDAALTELRAGLPGIEVLSMYAVGEPRDKVTSVLEAEDIDLIVFGRDRLTDGKSAWGPSGLKILRASACSVLVLPHHSILDLSRAVVGMDFSSNAIEGLVTACSICDEVEVIFQYNVRTVGTGAMTEDEFHRKFSASAEEHFRLDVAPKLCDGMNPTLRVVEGLRAHETLVAEARGRLITLGARGLTKVAASLLGSVAESVAGQANGPVLIWRKKGEQLGLIGALAHR